MHSFVSDEKITIMNCVFHFYDTNHDGVISILDLLHALSFVPCDCQFGKEIKRVLDTYFNDIVLSRRRRLIHEISKSIFDMFLESSCVVSELLSKLFKRPYKGWPDIPYQSIFTRAERMSEEAYNKQMAFYKKMYTDLYDEQSCDIVGSAYERINSFQDELNLK